MNKGWETKRLPEIAEYFIGLTYSPKDVSSKGTIVLRSSNIQNDALDLSDLVRVARPVKEALKVREGDILMCSRNGSKRLVGKTAVIGDLPEGMTFGTFMTIIRGKQNPYLAWFFKSDAFREQIGVGENTMINQITKYMLDDIRVPLPPPPEQQRIVALLDKAFDGIATATANVKKNLQNVHALYESHLQSVFARRGEGWTEKRLEDVCEEIFAGGDVPKGNCSEAKTDKHQIPIYTNGEKNKGLYGYTDTARVTSPSLTISARGTIGYAAIRNESYYPAIRLIVVIPTREIVDLLFLYYAIESIDIGHSGTSIPQLTVPMVCNFLISIPPLAEQRTIAAHLDALANETQRLVAIYERKLAALEALRKSLLHQAFTGQL